jgi:hypothetical protein
MQSVMIFTVPDFVDADGIEYTEIEVVVQMDGDIHDTVQVIEALQRPLATCRRMI